MSVRSCWLEMLKGFNCLAVILVFVQWRVYEPEDFVGEGAVFGESIRGNVGLASRM